MPTLDYAQSPRTTSRRTITIIVVAILLVALIFVGWEAPKWYRQWQAARLAGAYRLIDAQIPGTEVYFRGKLLGKTPLVLSKADCAAVGLPVTAGRIFDLDGWGEGVAFHDPKTNSDPRLMFKVPASDASSFLTYDTPWGSRTKMGGGWDLPNGIRSKFMSRGQNGIGVLVNINFNAKPDPSDKFLKISVSATNSGAVAYSGFRPEIEVLWGTFDVQWQRRSHQRFPLPDEWASIVPGQTLRTTVEIPVPAAAGDYSVFATLNVFQNKSDDYLAGHGSVYSDSKLLCLP
jgi:hypothetical protein